MESVIIQGSNRAEVGQKFSKQLRREGQVPCVLYGGESPVHFSAPQMAFRDLIYTPIFRTASIEVDGKSYRAVLQDSQFHPVSDKLLHVDFLQLDDNKRVTVKLPLKFEGQAAGVKEGGKLMPKLRTLTVKAFPKDLSSEISINVESLELGKSIKVKDVEAGSFEIMNNPNIPLASVEIPRALKSAEAEAEEAAAAAGDAPAAEGDAPAAEGEEKKEG